MIDYMLVKVCVEEGLKSKHSIAHGTFIDHPERQTEKYLGMGAIQMLLLGLHHAYNQCWCQSTTYSMKYST